MPTLPEMLDRAAARRRADNHSATIRRAIHNGVLIVGMLFCAFTAAAGLVVLIETSAINLWHDINGGARW